MNAPTVNSPLPSASPQVDQQVILVVDDEGLIRDLARMGLEGAGFFVLTACNGDEGLRASREFPGVIDLIISDVLMPGLDGFDLRKQLLSERPGIPVLMMSGQLHQGRNEDIPYLEKPFRISELRDRVQALLGRRAAKAQTAAQ